ncbi:MAG: helix-turn-helix transcriptional regulator [Oscillibacter sp.]|nr:helix-turn-helix transcriptional regulator [Oscillibacter sp.]
MQIIGSNIYQTARKAAGLTQEAAAERLALSVESLRAYETGVRVPGNDTVESMITVYNTQFLAVQHLRNTSNLLPACFAVEAQSLPITTIKLVNRIIAFAQKHRNDQLLAIAEDGVIDEQERPNFDEITAELDEIIQAALSLRYTQE